MGIKRTFEWAPDDDCDVCFEEDVSDDEVWIDDVESLSAEECGERLRDILLSLLFAGGNFSAKRLCTVAYWARRAGAIGVDELAFPPGKQSGQYQRHLDTKLKTQPKNLMAYKLDLPKYTKTELWRTIVPENVLLVQQVALAPF